MSYRIRHIIYNIVVCRLAVAHCRCRRFAREDHALVAREFKVDRARTAERQRERVRWRERAALSAPPRRACLHLLANKVAAWDYYWLLLLCARLIRRCALCALSYTLAIYLFIYKAANYTHSLLYMGYRGWKYIRGAIQRLALERGIENKMRRVLYVIYTCRASATCWGKHYYILKRTTTERDRGYIMSSVDSRRDTYRISWKEIYKHYLALLMPLDFNLCAENFCRAYIVICVSIWRELLTQ